MEIKTDRKWKQLKYFYELTDKQKGELDWIKDDLAPVFVYKNWPYSLDEFMRITDEADGLKGWDGYLSDTFFSGVVIKLSSDGEMYQVGLFLS